MRNFGVDIGPQNNDRSRAIVPDITCSRSLFWEQISLPNISHFEVRWVYLHFSEQPQVLEQVIDAYAGQTDIVAIDEIQRVPELLNEVHRLIEERQIKFLLTGSSARKLRKSGVNLLAGRAREARLLPLTYHEIANFDLERYLLYGGLPVIYLSDEPEEDLYAYVDTYLKEEIQSEAVVRKMPAFSRFLKVSALTNGQLVNFTNIASDTSVPATTIREYYHILEDTFLGWMLPAYTYSQKRKAISKAKFYFFDIGVKNILTDVKHLPKQSELYGQAFEHLIAMELKAYLSYRRIFEPLTYWRSKSGFEVDFIIGNNIAIEVKATTKVQDRHLKGLKAFAEEGIAQQYFLISQDAINRQYDNINIMYWQDFLDNLWNDQYHF